LDYAVAYAVEILDVVESKEDILKKINKIGIAQGLNEKANYIANITKIVTNIDEINSKIDNYYQLMEDKNAKLKNENLSDLIRTEVENKIDSIKEELVKTESLLSEEYSNLVKTLEELGVKFRIKTLTDLQIRNLTTNLGLICQDIEGSIDRDIRPKLGLLLKATPNRHNNPRQKPSSYDYEYGIMFLEMTKNYLSYKLSSNFGDYKPLLQFLTRNAIISEPEREEIERNLDKNLII
jgi:hypothetical protein